MLLKFKMTIKNPSGFTLIELIVLMTIMGILSSMSFITMAEFRNKARDGHRLAEIKQISKALEVYYMQHGYYPYFNNVAYASAPNNNWSKKELADIWGGILDELYGEDLIQQNPIYDISGFNMSIQDPTYHETSHQNSYEYMPSKNLQGLITEPQSFRIRVQLENSNSTAFSTSLNGYFLYADKDKGKYACDSRQGYYCIGPDSIFNAFKAKHNSP